MRILATTSILLVAFLATPPPAWADHTSAEDKHVEGDRIISHLDWESLANTGDAEAQRAIDRLNLAKDNYATTIARLRKAAEQSDTKALIALGSMYLKGQGMPQSDSKAHCLLWTAAKAGDPEAQFLYASLIAKEMKEFPGRKARYGRRAYAWLENAGVQGHAEALYFFSTVLGQYIDYEWQVTAYAALVLSAKLGNEKAIDMLGKHRKAARGFREVREALAVADEFAADWKPETEKPRTILLKKFRACLPEPAE